MQTSLSLLSQEIEKNMYSLTLFLILSQLARIQRGVKNVLKITIKRDIPSIPM